MTNGGCAVCGSDNFHVDAGRGDTICDECGAVDPDARVRVECVGYRSVFDSNGGLRATAPMGESYVGGATNETMDDAKAWDQRGRNKSAPYSRLTYFNERMAQWRGHEPPIPYEDVALIRKAFREKYPQGKNDLQKEELRSLLRSIDASQKTRKFVRKYLVSFTFNSS